MKKQKRVSREKAALSAYAFVAEAKIKEKSPTPRLRLSRTKNPLPRGTLGDLEIALRVSGPPQFPLTIIRQHFDLRELTGIDPATVRLFCWDDKESVLQPVWNSGINLGLGFIWAQITRPGLYIPIGLPRDRLLQEALRGIALQRRHTDSDTPEAMEKIMEAYLALLLKAPPDAVQQLRRYLTTIEVQTGVGPFLSTDIKPGPGGHLLPFPFPRGATLKEFRQRLARLIVPEGGLPEEELFFPPEGAAHLTAPWALKPGQTTLANQIDRKSLLNLQILDWHPGNLNTLIPVPWPWLFSQDWWMYHHDAQHTGHASGLSSINKTSVNRLYLYRKVDLGDGGRVITIPSIVNGKIFAGTINASAGGGNLFKIDIASGTVEGTPYNTTARSPAYDEGIGGSPAIVGGKVYFTDIPGRVYCVDATTLALVWKTDLRYPDLNTMSPALGQNQPVNNPNADCWSGPLVANGKVYVGCGEGESAAFGFVYCLDANSGRVIWLFCTNQFVSGTDNGPNVVPASAAGVSPLPPGFSTHADPAFRGASIWSSCAYDSTLNRIYVGTGNTTADLTTGPVDERYGSGVLALDADTGDFMGFFQPDRADSYHPGDSDIDVPASPTLFTQGGHRVVAIGSKSGAFFFLDANTMLPLTTPRQLLPKTGGDGFRGDGSVPLSGGVDPVGGGGGENMFGVFGTAAIHYGLGYLYVGLGGYGSSIDSTTTPFLRALRWNDLSDAWHTVLGTDGVKRYDVPNPPMYTHPGEAGLSSPAVVNDIVFVSTSARHLYALDAATGLCLWNAPGIASAPIDWDTCIMGPAVSGDYVVIGSEGSIYIYTLGLLIPHLPPIYYALPPWWQLILPPPPPPPPDPLIDENMQGGFGT